MPIPPTHKCSEVTCAAEIRRFSAAPNLKTSALMDIAPPHQQLDPLGSIVATRRGTMTKVSGSPTGLLFAPGARREWPVETFEHTVGLQAGKDAQQRLLNGRLNLH